MKLTAKTIALLTLPSGKSDHIEWDDELRRFGYRLRRSADGKVRRSWICQYRFRGASRRILLGSAEVLGAEAARAAAKKCLAEVALGGDPQADRTDRRGKDRMTMQATVAEFLAHKQAELAPRTFVESKRYLSDPKYFGGLHKLPLDQIHRRDIAACTVAIVRECGSPTAARARGALSSFFSWAMRMGLTEVNPTVGAIVPSAGSGRKRVLSDAELAAIWKACGADEYGKILKLLILTACRRAEIGDLVWPELTDSTLTISAERSKNGRAHVLPLMPMMREIISSIPPRATRNQLFGWTAKGFTAWAKSKVELDARSGVTDWTVHDIRRSVATRLGDLGVLPHVIEVILNHQSGHKSGPAGIYNRSVYMNEVRNALALWEDHIRSIVAGIERRVVAFKAS